MWPKWMAAGQDIYNFLVMNSTIYRVPHEDTCNGGTVKINIIYIAFIRAYLLSEIRALK